MLDPNKLRIKVLNMLNADGIKIDDLFKYGISETIWPYWR